MNVSRKYDLAIFDLDGTLADTSEGIIHAAMRTLEIMHIDGISPNTIRSCIGPPLATSLVKLGIIDESNRNTFNVTFRKMYENEYLLEAEMFDGVDELLQTIRKSGMKIAVATNKPETFSKKLLNDKKMADYFEIIAGPDLNGSLKKEDLIKQCLEYTGTSAKSAVMIGDTEHDMNAARNTGVDFVGVSYGYGFSDKEEMIQTPLELLGPLGIE